MLRFRSLSTLFKAFVPHKGAQTVPIPANDYTHLFEAQKGRGKTYFCVSLIYHYLSQGRSIVTNIRSLHLVNISRQLVLDGFYSSYKDAMLFVSDSVRFLTNWDDFVTSYNEVIVIDECSRMFNCLPQQSIYIPPLVLEWIRQSRHARCSLYFITQDFSWINKRVASLVDFIHSVRRVDDPKTGLPLSFWAYGKESGGAGGYANFTRDEWTRKFSFPFSNSIASMYNTHEIVKDISSHCSFETMDDLSDYYHNHGHISEVDQFSYLREELSLYSSSVSDPLDSSCDSFISARSSSPYGRSSRYKKNTAVLSCSKKGF